MNTSIVILCTIMKLAAGLCPTDCMCDDNVGVIDCTGMDINVFPDVASGPFDSGRFLYFQNNLLSSLPPPENFKRAFPQASYLDIRGNPLPCLDARVYRVTIEADCLLSDANEPKFENGLQTHLAPTVTNTMVSAEDGSSPTTTAAVSPSSALQSDSVVSGSSTTATFAVINDADESMTVAHVAYAIVGVLAILLTGIVFFYSLRRCVRMLTYRRAASEETVSAIEMSDVSPIVEEV